MIPTTATASRKKTSHWTRCFRSSLGGWKSWEAVAAVASIGLSASHLSPPTSFMIGRKIARTMPPTSTPMTAIMSGSIKLVSDSTVWLTCWS